MIYYDPPSLAECQRDDYERDKPEWHMERPFREMMATEWELDEEAWRGICRYLCKFDTDEQHAAICPGNVSFR
jgi:hypothetical protein